MSNDKVQSIMALVDRYINIPMPARRAILESAIRAIAAPGVAVYQVQIPGGWRDCHVEQYKMTLHSYRRVVYLAPSPTAEQPIKGGNE